MTTHVTFRNVVQVGGSSLPDNNPRASETLTETGTSQQTTITAKRGEMCRIVATAAIHVAVGSNPTAAADTGDMIPIGGTLDIPKMNEGDKVAIKTI